MKLNINKPLMYIEVLQGKTVLTFSSSFIDDFSKIDEITFVDNKFSCLHCNIKNTKVKMSQFKPKERLFDLSFKDNKKVVLLNPAIGEAKDLTKLVVIR